MLARETNEVNDRLRALAQESEARLDCLGRRLMDPLSLDDLLDEVVMSLVVAHVDNSVLDWVDEAGGSRVQALGARLQGFESLLAPKNLARRRRHDFEIVGRRRGLAAIVQNDT